MSWALSNASMLAWLSIMNRAKRNSLTNSVQPKRKRILRPGTSRRARHAFAEAEAGRWTVRVPAVVLMQVVLLEHRGRLRISYRELRDQLSIRPGLPIEPLMPEDVDEARALAALTDPFDCLIAGTARRLGLALLTNDEAITGTGLIRAHW